MLGWTLSEAKQRCQVTEIGSFLEQGQLAGYARPAGRENDLVAIPQSAWSDMKIVDEAGTCLVHLPSKTEFLDLRIYSILHAPDAPELLHDRGLAEVFKATIVWDPEVAVLGRAVMKAGDFGYVFLEGNAPSPYIDPHWPIDQDSDSIAFEFVRPIMWFAGDPLPRPSTAMTAAATALADRIAALRTLLSSGRLVAAGTHQRSGLLVPIHRTQWLRTNQAIDVANGDLCEGGSKWTVIWSGVILEHPKPELIKSVVARFQQMIEAREKSPRVSVAAKKQCQAWLEEIMRASPDTRTVRSDDLYEEARKKWKGLSRRAFNRAQEAAAESVGAVAWSIGGRIRKTSAPKTSAPK